MNTAFLSFVAAAALIWTPVTGLTQTLVPGAAQAEAQARLVCGAGTVLSATYLPGGLLQVTCRANAVQQSSTVTASELPALLEGTSLVPTVTAGVLTVVVVATVLNGEETSSSTSTTGTAEVAR